MEMQKPIKMIIISLILLLIIVVTSLYIHLHQKSMDVTQGRPLKSSVDNEATADDITDKEKLLSKIPGKIPVSSDKPKPSSNNEADDLPDQNDDIQENVVFRLEGRLSDERTEDTESDGVSSLRDSFYEEYHELFEGLNLTPKALTELLDMLIVKGIALPRIGDNWKDFPSEDEYKQAYKDIVEEYDLKAKQILDTDDFEIYQQFEATLYERRRLIDFVSNPEVYLDEGQQQDLIEAMHEEIKETGLEWINIEYFATVFSFNNDESNEDAIANLDRIHEAYINASKEILSPSQAELFDAQNKKLREKYMRLISEM